MTYKVFLDSDGVLADFDSRAVELLEGRRIHEVPKGLLWARIERYDREVAKFFETLPLMPNAAMLVEFVQANFDFGGILTATGYTPKDGAAQKARWYAQHFPGVKVICVDKSADKAVHALGAILVDDRTKSLDPWIEKGGIGILHTSVEDTIEQLRQYI